MAPGSNLWRSCRNGGRHPGFPERAILRGMTQERKPRSVRPFARGLHLVRTFAPATMGVPWTPRRGTQRQHTHSRRAHPIWPAPPAPRIGDASFTRSRDTRASSRRSSRKRRPARPDSLRLGQTRSRGRNRARDEDERDERVAHGASHDARRTEVAASLPREERESSAARARTSLFRCRSRQATSGLKYPRVSALQKEVAARANGDLVERILWQRVRPLPQRVRRKDDRSSGPRRGTRARDRR